MLTRNTGTIKTFCCVVLIVTMLLTSFRVNAENLCLPDGQTNTYDMDEVSTMTVEAETKCGPSEIENGAIYAMQNVGSELWASTSLNSVTYFYLWNMFQHSCWNNSAQAFMFVKSDGGDDTFFICPLEYNDCNASGTRALFCNYNLISAEQPEQTNVTYANYDESKRTGFEWVVEKEDGYIHTIRLKADPKYILCGLGDTAGNDNSYDEGNIVVYRQATASSIPTEYQKWNLTYVVPEGEYFLKNRGSEMFMQGGHDVLAEELAGTDMQKWELDHYQNGLYQIYRTGETSLVYLTSTANGGDVTLTGNNMQPSSMWYFYRLEGGTFKIKSMWTESLNLDYALQPQGLDEGQIINKSYSAGITWLEEWFLIPTDGIYGMQTYRFGGSCETYSNPSLAYALNLGNEAPNTFTEKNFVAQYHDLYIHDSYVNSEDYHEEVYEDFEEWIENSYFDNITITLESDFLDNGTNRILLSNEFRIALRTGIHKDLAQNVNGINYYRVIADYHFWYQMYDGSWAHIRTTSNIPELLDKTVTPSSIIGWDMENYKYSYEIEGAIFLMEYDKDFFFDSEVRVYIVTIE